MARDYAKVSPRFWTGDTGKKLRRNRSAQVLATYLISAPGSTMTGIYYLPLPIISHETGMTMEEVLDALLFLASMDFAHYDGVAELVWVPAMASWQIGASLKPNDNQVKGIRRELAAFNNHEFVIQFWERYGEAFSLGPTTLVRGARTPSKGLRSQEQDQDQEQEHEQEIPPPPAPARDPLVATEVSEPWTGYRWLVKFSAAWCDKYQRLSYGQGDDDAKAARSLSEFLATLSPADRAAAETDAPRMLAEYLGSTAPGRVGARHPFKWFAADFSGLRVPAVPIAIARGSPPRDIRVGHVRAEDCDHTAEGIQKL